MPTRLAKANALRVLSMDAVQQANSGHPGAPMGMADIAEVLWNDFLKHNPENPHWPDRDRFVLSNGHASVLLYALLHLSGYDLDLHEFRNFRQLHSKTPGHPEYGVTPGVETTTGPLGQGIANAVGMAIAERTLAGQFNREGFEIVDHHTWVFAGDGCLMEGISHEACSLAGTLGLGKLTLIYDDNGISIDGEVSGWFTEDVPQRFAAYGWRVIPAVDGHDPKQIRRALAAARAETARPSLICCKTRIGRGAPNKEGKESCHGAPLGAAEVAATRQNLGWYHPPFVIPETLYQAWDARPAGRKREQEWQARFAAYQARYPELAEEFLRRTRGDLPQGWSADCAGLLQEAVAKAETVATRKGSQQALEKLGPRLPELIGGSADLAGSNLTIWSGSKDIRAQNHSGNYIYYGVREFAMAAINSGIALHGGFIPYGATFLIFSDYARNALRMAALMKLRSIFVLTHDSIGLGEDGPTHQAVEQAATLRLIPNMSVWRPADAVETLVAWQSAIERREGPTCLLLSRQNLSHIPRDAGQLAGIRRGAYVLIEAGEVPDVILIATGSELGITLTAAQRLNEEGRRVRVVSMPCTDLFDRQDAAYREQVLPLSCRKRIAIEAGAPDYWRKYVGLDGLVLGVPDFGESAPAEALFKRFGLTTEGIMELVRNL